MVADFPQVPKYRENLAEMYWSLGDVLKELGRLEDADEAYRKAEELEKEEVPEEEE